MKTLLQYCQDEIEWAKSCLYGSNGVYGPDDGLIEDAETDVAYLNGYIDAMDNIIKHETQQQQGLAATTQQDAAGSTI